MQGAVPALEQGNGIAQMRLSWIGGGEECSRSQRGIAGLRLGWWEGGGRENQGCLFCSGFRDECKEEGSRGQRFGSLGLWVFVLRQNPVGNQAKPESCEHLPGASNRNPRGSFTWGVCSPIGDASSRRNTPTNPNVGLCVPGRGQCHPPGTSLPSAATSEPHPSRTRSFYDVKDKRCCRPDIWLFFITFSSRDVFLCSSKPGFVCLFFKSKSSNPSICEKP